VCVLHLAHFHVVIDGCDMQRTASIIVGGVDSIWSLSQQPAHEVFAPRHDGLVQRIVPFDVADPEVGTVCPQYT